MTAEEPLTVQPRTRIVPQTVRGMRDHLPPAMILRQYVADTLRAVFERFGFDPLQTPAIEYAETLEGKYGEEADRLIYTFEDRGGRRVGLRYDLTVPLARVVAQYPDLPKPFKRYQIAPCWRAERPQRGRYREFVQCDVDIVGSASMLADAEVVTVACVAFQTLGFKHFTVRLNHRKVLAGLAEVLGLDPQTSAQVYRSVDKLDKIGPEGVRAELAERGLAPDLIDRLFEFFTLTGPSRDILTTLRERLQASAVGLEGLAELEALLDALAMSGVSPQFYRLDLSMVRGLEYYTGPIFEAVVEEPRIGSIAGGGRYDRLIGLFSGRDYPATGLSIGLDRVCDVIEELGLRPPDLRPTLVEALVTVFNSDLAPESIRLANELRAAGRRVSVYLGEDTLRAQLRYAHRLGVPYVLILGPDEMARQVVIVRDMATGAQTEVPRTAVATALPARAPGG